MYTGILLQFYRYRKLIIIFHKCQQIMENCDLTFIFKKSVNAFSIPATHFEMNIQFQNSNKILLTLGPFSV